jgi:RES domain-containing protein
LIPRLFRFRGPDTHRLIPSRFPPVGLFDDVASADDIPIVQELEGWTNDRISSELGILNTLPKAEWVVGVQGASVIMAAFCHPNPQGGRFNDADRGAWYAARKLETAIEETIFHKTKEFDEIGVYDNYVQMREYLADFDCAFYDVRQSPQFDACHDPASYKVSQELARKLLADGANGIIYRSVRHSGGECVVCFRPRLITNVRQGAHFEYRWNGSRRPIVTKLTAT